MINYEIFYNKVHKGSCNLIKETKKGCYIAIDKASNYLLIDNIRIAPLNEVNSIRFLIRGYYQQIDVSPNEPIYTVN